MSRRARKTGPPDEPPGTRQAACIDLLALLEAMRVTPSAQLGQRALTPASRTRAPRTNSIGARRVG